jgi:hypothetical protein
LAAKPGKGGAKVIDRLAHDLRAAFPDMKGFSPRSLKYIRAFAQSSSDTEFVQQAAAQLPWFHLCTLIGKLESREERLHIACTNRPSGAVFLYY